MKKWARDVRLMPIVLIAIVCLFVLKTMGLLFDGGYTLGQRLGSGGTLIVTTVPMAQTQQMRSPSVPLEMPPQPGAAKQPSFMQEMFGYPGGDRSAIASRGNPDITGSVAAKPAEKKDRRTTRRKTRDDGEGAAPCRRRRKHRRPRHRGLDGPAARGIAGRARLAGAVAGAPPGARGAHARARAPRKPGEGRGKEAGDAGGLRKATRPREAGADNPGTSPIHGSRASSPCTRR